MTAFQQAFSRLAPGIEIRFSEPLAKYTSFRIGGPAEALALPKNPEELKTLLAACGALGAAPAILGAGTNVLAPDEGIQGAVICLRGLCGAEDLGAGRVRFGAGLSLARAADFAAKLGLSGLEFAHGIPGTVGGGVYMNAGAYGGEIGQVCTEATTLDFQGRTHRYSREELSFSYRHSRMQELMQIVVSAEFALIPAPEEQIRAQMRELSARRRASQPLEYPSAGSAFKRPREGYAAALIDGAGLKGFRVGDAQVSEKHAGFVINRGAATAEQVKELLRRVTERVYEDSGITLEPEIRLW